MFGYDPGRVAQRIKSIYALDKARSVRPTGGAPVAYRGAARRVWYPSTRGERSARSATRA